MKLQKFGTKLLISISLILIFTSLIISFLSYEVTSSVLEENLLTYSDEYLTQLSRNLENAQEKLDDEVFDSINRAGLLNNKNLNKYMNNDSDIITREFTSLVAIILSSDLHVKAISIKTIDNSIYFQRERNEIIEETELIEMIDLYGDKASIMRYLNEDYLVIVKPLYDLNDTRLLGHMAIAVDNQYLLDEFSQNPKYSEWKILVLDERQSVLASQDTLTEKLYSGIKDELPTSGKIQYPFIADNIHYISNIVTSPEGNIRVMNIIPVESVQEASSKLMVLIIWIGLGALLINFIIALFISRGFSKNIRILVGRIRQFKEGDFDTKIVIKSNDEISMMADEFNEMAEEINHLVNKVYHEKVLKEKARKEAIKFEYNALQAKMNPHFLYNVLESINSMAKIEGNDNVSEVVCILGELLRESIGDDRTNIFLEDELAYVGKYLKLKQITSKNNIVVNYDIDEMLLGAVVPKFILQPIVENAVVHGFRKMDKIGIITIACHLIEGNIMLEVRDDGTGFDPSHMDISQVENENRWQRTRIGINSIDKRLKILYGELFGIILKSEPGEGTVVTLTMPYQTKVDSKDGL